MQYILVANKHDAREIYGNNFDQVYFRGQKHLWKLCNYKNSKHTCEMSLWWDAVIHISNIIIMFIDTIQVVMLTLKIGFLQKIITTVGDNSLYRITMVLSPPINGIYAKLERLGHEWTIISIIFTGNGGVIIFLPSVFVHACVCVCVCQDVCPYESLWRTGATQTIFCRNIDGDV